MPVDVTKEFNCNLNAIILDKVTSEQTMRTK